MKTKPTVTVLIPTFNRAHLLLECLDSVLAQTIPPTQIIVINDGSTDNTSEVLQPYLGKIEYLEKKNEGKSQALNLALPRAKGKYIWVMDDDDVALPDALETHLNVLEKDPTIGFTHTSAYLAEMRLGEKKLQAVELRKAVQSEELFLDLLEADILRGFPAVVVRADCYKEVGPFDPDLIRSQDYDMILRLARQFRVRAIEKPTVMIRRHRGDRGTAAKKIAVSEVPSAWRAYDQQIFRRLRETLDFSEYLPTALRKMPLGPIEIRRARLKRMAVMASKGLVAEMVDDLESVLASPEADLPLSPPERGAIVRAINHLWPKEMPILLRELSSRRLRANRSGVEIKVEIARGLYWRAERNLRALRLRRLVRILRVSRKVLGAKDYLAAIKARFRKRVPIFMSDSEYLSYAIEEGSTEGRIG